MQHARPVQGQLGGLIVVQMLEAPGSGHDVRVGGVDSVDRFPQVNLLGADGGADPHRGEVGTIAAQGGDVTLRVQGDEPGHDRDARYLHHRAAHRVLGAGQRAGQAAAGLAEQAEVEGVHRRGGQAGRAQGRGHHPGAHALAEGQHEVTPPAIQAAVGAHALEHGPQLDQVPVQELGGQVQLAQDRPVTDPQTVRVVGPPSGALGGGQEEVGDALVGADNHQGRGGPPVLDDLHGPSHRRAVAQGRAAELVHPDRFHRARIPLRRPGATRGPSLGGGRAIQWLLAHPPPEGAGGTPPRTMADYDRSELIYDWNTVSDSSHEGTVQFDDETLRDGLQSPSVRDPDLDQKIELIHLMDRLGIDTADVGLPGAGARARDHIATLCREMAGLRITPNVACRTLVSDIEPVVDLVQEVGEPVEVCAFIGSSPIRQYAEGWDFDRMLELSREAVEFCARHDLPCMFVTEDTTRARPEDVRRLYGTAIEAGARRICICDTCGHATPAGVASLVRYVRELVDEMGVDVGIDWHGHRDRGMGLVNAVTAIQAGATRVHATALGVGERAGNTEMDLLLVNLKLMGVIDNDLSALAEYCRKAAEACGVPIPHNYSVFGQDAFETGTGVHAAAVIKAYKKGDAWLADRVYSGVPAGMFGLEQVIKVGPMSGKSNVAWVLEHHGVEVTDDAVLRVLELAKETPRLLTDDEVLAAARG